MFPHMSASSFKSLNMFLIVLLNPFLLIPTSRSSSIVFFFFSTLGYVSQSPLSLHLQASWCGRYEGYIVGSLDFAAFEGVELWSGRQLNTRCSLTRGWTCVPCTVGRILNHWTNNGSPTRFGFELCLGESFLVLSLILGHDLYSRA